jgi:PilZ domain
VDGSERRRHERYACKATVQITWGGVTIDATLRDISLSGMYLETQEPLWARAEFSARVLLPEVLNVKCIVRRAIANSGMVVEFIDMSQESRMNLSHLIWKLSHP